MTVTDSDGWTIYLASNSFLGCSWCMLTHVQDMCEPTPAHRTSFPEFEHTMDHAKSSCYRVRNSVHPIARLGKGVPKMRHHHVALLWVVAKQVSLSTGASPRDFQPRSACRFWGGSPLGVGIERKPTKANHAFCECSDLKFKSIYEAKTGTSCGACNLCQSFRRSTTTEARKKRGSQAPAVLSGGLQVEVDGWDWCEARDLFRSF